MIRSLYIRIVLTFLATVIVSFIIAALAATAVFHKKLTEVLYNDALSFSQDVSRIYEILPTSEADLYVSGMEQLHSYYIRIFGETGQIETYGALNETNLNGYEGSSVTPEQVKRVLGGEVYRDLPKSTAPFFVGVPLRTEHGTKAMFVQPIYSTGTILIQWSITIFVFSLIAGSVFILIAAIFLVSPLKKLTKATRQLAEGDFNVKLNMKQKDELGTLARSFEEMTHDLQQLEQMRRDFVSNVSHEVQSPLTSISGYAKALKFVDIAENERSRYLDIIIAESERVSKMSDNLLKLAMLEARQHPLSTVTYRLDEQIRKVIIVSQPLWSARSIHLEPDLPNAIITADQDQLNQVWTNLLGNSIKFSPDVGTISVSIQPGIQEVSVRFVDNGIGISTEDQRRIFERFFKADRSHNRKIQGSGLGLAIVKQIVSLHQGDIRVESELGRGTTIVVTLPVVPPTV
ncbi:sensor histidine kinase [Cohnella nanjingensis]|uniref:Heme sensor protein HssS n=1 Tax=Cohnella nanjingensis TaxID=1387779 RepID=A0A7X0RPE0_9BACL|nr:HAMP domain-containing sensor histidine kinase [Cohnella nanjingensis]MBB6670081.1 HAMP domain-containing protein [Cohnella nanjingensis]